MIAPIAKHDVDPLRTGYGGRGKVCERHEAVEAGRSQSPGPPVHAASFARRLSAERPNADRELLCGHAMRPTGTSGVKCASVVYEDDPLRMVVRRCWRRRTGRWSPPRVRIGLAGGQDGGAFLSASRPGVAALLGPFVVLLGRDGSGGPDDRVPVGEGPDDVGAPAKLMTLLPACGSTMRAWCRRSNRLPRRR